jgi:glycosyltransferase involved in cell wall biosynthesis
MTTAPRISVIIPSLNDADLLSNCLAALTAQRRPADEIIVVDNGSTDATAQVARDAGATVVHEAVRGTLSATAAGFDAATGSILARLDADSVPAPDWLERVEAALAAAGAPAAVTGPGVFYGASAPVRWFGRHVYLASYFRLMEVLLGHPPFFCSNLAMHAEVWWGIRERMDRGVRALHDDMAMSIQLEPGVLVVVDDGLTVGISARPFSSPAAISRRLWWGCVTVMHGYRREPLHRRRARWHAAETASRRSMRRPVLDGN